MTITGMKQASELRRVIGLPHAIAMVVGIIIGSSIFVQPSSVTNMVPSVTGVIFVWLASGILTLFGALVCAELASIFKESGGVYVYLKEAFSPLLGFMWGWAMFWIMHSGIIAAIAVIFARYVAYYFPVNDIEIKLIAIACIWLLSAVNYFGVRQGSALQTFITVIKVASIVLIIILGFTLGSQVPEHFVKADFPGEGLNVKNFLLAMIAGLFAFGGWHMVTYSSDETKQPHRTIPRALIIGTVIVTLCYIAMNALYMYLLPLDTVASSTRIAADAAEAIFGFSGGGLMAGLVILSTFGAVNGVILAGPRVYYAMARDGLLFKWIGAIHSRFKTPARATIVQAIWASMLVFTGTYKELFTRVVYTEWIFFGLLAIGLIIIRRRPGIIPAFKVKGNYLVPLSFSIFSFIIVINQILVEPVASITGLLLVLAGLPVYYIWLRNQTQKRQ